MLSATLPQMVSSPSPPSALSRISQGACQLRSIVSSPSVPLRQRPLFHAMTLPLRLPAQEGSGFAAGAELPATRLVYAAADPRAVRSEEHTSELQSQSNLVCRLLLEKKKTQE